MTEMLVYARQEVFTLRPPSTGSRWTSPTGRNSCQNNWLNDGHCLGGYIPGSTWSSFWNIQKRYRADAKEKMNLKKQWSSIFFYPSSLFLTQLSFYILHLWKMSLHLAVLWHQMSSDRLLIITKRNAECACATFIFRKRCDLTCGNGFQSLSHRTSFSTALIFSAYGFMVFLSWTTGSFS